MGSLLFITLVNAAVMALAVLIHYEFLYKLTSLIPKLKIVHRFRIVIGVLGALIAHVIYFS
jgi:hypothetical protein